jgi:mRNA interferase YafQ
MFEIKVEAQFKADYKRTMRIHPQLKTEFKAAVAELAARGSLPAEYGAHELSNPGGNYNGHIDQPIYPMGWSMWPFCTCRIRLIL